MTNLSPIDMPAVTRPVQLAAIHSAAAYLADTPELPIPNEVDMHIHHLPTTVVEAIADAYGEKIKKTQNTMWVTIPITVEALHGIKIQYTAFARRHPCDDGRCTDPAAHAEGAHDL